MGSLEAHSMACLHFADTASQTLQTTKTKEEEQEARVKYVSLPPNLVKMSERMSAAVSECNARLQKWL